MKTSVPTNAQIARRLSSARIIWIGIRLPSMPHKSTGQSLNVLISGGRRVAL